MLRAALAAACLAAAGAATAQELQLHGLLDVSAGRFENSGAPSEWRVDSGSMSTSFIGVRGSDDLGGGLKARFAFEHYLRLDSGRAGRFDGDAFWARDAYIGLSGAFGTTVLGRNTTPLFMSTLQFNAFGDSYAFSPSVRQVFTPALLPFFGDNAWSNSIAYASGDEDGNGFSQHVIGALDEGAAGSRGANYGVSFAYEKGPLAAALTWQRVRHGQGITESAVALPAGFARQDTWQIGVAYDLALVKLYGQYTHVRTRDLSGSRMEIGGLGATLPLGAGRVLAQYGYARARSAGIEPSHSTLSLGYDHALSKRTDAYAAYMNDRVSRQNRGHSLAAGMRLRF
jgi:predicted porin